MFATFKADAALSNEWKTNNNNYYSNMKHAAEKRKCRRAEGTATKNIRGVLYLVLGRTQKDQQTDRQTDRQRRASEHSKNQDRCVSGWLDGWLNGGPHKANSQCLSVLVGMECNNLNRFQLDLYESFQALLLLLPDSAGGWLAVCVCECVFIQQPTRTIQPEKRSLHKAEQIVATDQFTFRRHQSRN